MRKEFEINGCIEVSPEVTEDKFWEKFINFVESNGCLLYTSRCV